MPACLAERVNASPALRRRGRHLDCVVLLAIGADRWIIKIHDGAIEALRPASPVMESWTLAMSFDPAAWVQFLRPLPPPGFHDLMALLRGKKLRLEGDLYPFMSHLFWFKEAFATLRDSA